MRAADHAAGLISGFVASLSDARGRCGDRHAAPDRLSSRALALDTKNPARGPGLGSGETWEGTGAVCGRAIQRREPGHSPASTSDRRTRMHPSALCSTGSPDEPRFVQIGRRRGPNVRDKQRRARARTGLLTPTVRTRYGGHGRDQSASGHDAAGRLAHDPEPDPVLGIAGASTQPRAMVRCGVFCAPCAEHRIAQHPTSRAGCIAVAFSYPFGAPVRAPNTPLTQD